MPARKARLRKRGTTLLPPKRALPNTNSVCGMRVWRCSNPRKLDVRRLHRRGPQPSPKPEIRRKSKSSKRVCRSKKKNPQREILSKLKLAALLPISFALCSSQGSCKLRQVADDGEGSKTRFGHAPDCGKFILCRWTSRADIAVE